jgi:hypothetical protein
VDRSQLSKDLAGTYAYKSKGNSTTPPTTLNYYAIIPGYDGRSSWVFGSLIHYPIGSLTITAYDAQRKLLSGRFTATMANTSDPMETDNAPISRRCDLSLSGTFTDLVLKGAE